MTFDNISLELAVPLVIVALAALFLLVVFLKRRAEGSYYKFAWLPTFLDVFTKHRSDFDEDKPRKRRGPGMAFSAGRDAAHQNYRLQQVFIPMEAHEEESLRDFYLDKLGLMEMRPPNSHLNQDGFWAISGTRQLYFGTMPDFEHDITGLPMFSVPNLRDVIELLTSLGYALQTDRSNKFLDIILVVDPAGNEIGLIPR